MKELSNEREQLLERGTAAQRVCVLWVVHWKLPCKSLFSTPYFLHNFRTTPDRAKLRPHLESVASNYLRIMSKPRKFAKKISAKKVLLNICCKHEVFLTWGAFFPSYYHIPISLKLYSVRRPKITPYLGSVASN